MCCTQETFISMCAAYRIIETAPHVCHTQADEVCTHLSKVCTICAMVTCSMHAVDYVLEAYILHINNCTHSACMYSAHLMYLYVSYMWLVSIFTPHAQRERGKVISRGVHIYIYIYVCGRKKNLNRTLEIDSPFQTLTAGLLVEFIG